MSDIAVDFFQENLKQLITCSKLRLIIEEKHQLQSLEEEIKNLRGFLKVTEKKRNDHPGVMKLVLQIRDLVSEAENIVELFVVHASKVDHAPYSPREHLSLDLESVKKGMKTVTAEVKKIYDENMYNINAVAVKQLKHSSTGSGGIGSGSPRGSHTSKVVKEKVVVGFKEEVEKLIEKLDRGKGKPLEIISIIGAGGGGKTTLAREVYDHRFTSYAFEIRAWIDVSQDYDKTRKRNLLIHILESVMPKKREDYEEYSPKKLEDYEEHSDDKLGEDILKCLKGRKYLIVMDDIWGVEAWNDIQRSFPREFKGSKVLFTSRLVVQLDSVSYVPHYLAPLPKNSCWKLLEKKVFGMKCCPLELVDIGEKIVEKCEGLPLVVVTIAGILATEDKTLDVWEKVAKHLSSIIAKNPKGCMEILELSYNHLPHHLKACFVYIGGYPKDKEILVRELIWLWIAEGFIQQSEGGKSLETIAKDYLISLIDRSLVQVRESPRGGIKACRIHDLLRELCLKKAKDDNFLVKVYEDVSFSPSATNNHPRVLSAHGKWDRKMGIGHLVHLRYLAYEFGWSCKFPFSNLLNLETLNLDVLSYNDTVPLPRDIFKMVKLRHLYSRDGVFTFHHSSEEIGGNDFDHSSTLDSLQTLSKVCACEACRSLLVRTPNLRKLGLHSRASWRDNVLRFPDLEFLNCLEALSFTVDMLSPIKVKRTLSPGLKLPVTITRITFKYTRLKWEELSLLKTLPSLEVLRLIFRACCGPVWNIGELEGFPLLKYLKFDCLDIEEWNAFEYQFPNLEVLVVERCYNLERIPNDFGKLNELREIKLVDCRSSAEESAREIQEEQRNRTGDDYCLSLLAKDNTY